MATEFIVKEDILQMNSFAISVAHVPVSNAEILALNVTKKVLVPEQGVGKIVCLAGPPILKYNYGGIAFVGGGNLIFGTDTLITATSNIGNVVNRSYGGTANKITAGLLTAVLSSAATDNNFVDNKALVCLLVSAATVGNGTWDLYVPYYILTL